MEILLISVLANIIPKIKKFMSFITNRPECYGCVILFITKTNLCARLILVLASSLLSYVGHRFSQFKPSR